MIIFVTGQYAGAQYLHPLLRSWKLLGAKSPRYKLLSTGSSTLYWRENGIKYIEISTKNPNSIANYLKVNQPRLIVLSASGSEEIEYIFILQAKKLGIETANFIDTWTNYKNRFIYQNISVYPDTILSINEKCTEEMVQDGIPENIIKEIGQPYLEEVCNIIPPLGKQILLPLQPIKKAFDKRLGYDELTFLKTTVPALAQSKKKLQINITKHPDSDASVDTNSGFKLSVGHGLYDVKNCHTVIGMFSMQMIIGYLWNRKVASVQTNLKVMDPSPLSRWGFIPRIENKKDLIKFLNLWPSDTDKHRSLLISQINGSLKRLDSFLLR
jgi:hypothetical protein